MAKVLLLLDMVNLWDSCRTQYGKRARVDFKALLNKAKTKKTDTVDAVAFIANKPDKNQDNLVKKLNEFGIFTATKIVQEEETVDFSGEMLTVMDAVQYEALVVGGGSSTIIPVLKHAVAEGKHTMVVAFCNGITKETASAADDVRLLQKFDTITQ